MLRIAVCDDEPAQLAELTRLATAYVEAHPALSGHVASFATGRALLEAVSEGGGFDLYLLDVIMPDLNGIETGRALRLLGDGGEIVFVTNSSDYAVESYDVRAFFYLVKPVGCDRLFSVLDEAANRLAKRRQRSITVPTHEGSRRLLTDRILYAERVGRAVRYYCTDGTVDTQTIRTSFREAMKPLLADARFQLCGASFLVNLEHVAAIEGHAAVLDDGSEVPLPRTAAASFKLAWGKFWLKGSQ